MNKSKLFHYFTLFCVFIAPFTVFSANFEQTVQKYRNFLHIPYDSPFISIYLLLALLLAILSFFKPKIALIAMLFFILISTDIQVDKSANSERGVSIRMEDIVLLLVTGGWLLNRAKNRSLSIIKNVPINRGIIVMSLAMIISTLLGFFQDTVPVSRGILFTMKRLEYFWIFFMVLHTIETKEEAVKMLRLTFVAALLVAIIGIVQSFLSPSSPLTGGGTTATAGFGRANTLASFYLVMTGISVGLLVYLEDRREQIFYLASLSVFILAIVLTKSRGAYVSLPPLFFAAYVICKRTKFLFFILNSLAIMALFYLSTFFSGDLENLTRIHQDDIKGQFVSIGSVAVKGPEADSSFYARYTACRDIFPKIMDYPFFGHGVGAMFLGYLDNQYFHELYDTGFLGLFALLFFNFTVFIALYHFFHSTDDNFSRGLSMGLIAAQAGILVHGLTITNFYTILNMEAFCVILAIVMIMYYNEKQEKINNSFLPSSQRTRNSDE